MKFFGFVVLAAATLVAVPLSAHHAATGYDRDHPITVIGTVTKFTFANPHVQIYFDGKDPNGEMQSWVAVSGTPRGLFKAGWKRNSLKPGDQITVTGGPSKDGKFRLGIKSLMVDTGSSKGLTLGVGPE